jgi:hypothetical protein
VSKTPPTSTNNVLIGRGFFMFPSMEIPIEVVIS